MALGVWPRKKDLPFHSAWLTRSYFGIIVIKNICLLRLVLWSNISLWNLFSGVMGLMMKGGKLAVVVENCKSPELCSPHFWIPIHLKINLH